MLTDYATHPFVASDILAIVMATAATLCLVIWRRDAEPGMGWIAACFFVLSLWTATYSLHRPLGAEVSGSWWLMLPCIAQIFLVIGLLGYLQTGFAEQRLSAWPIIFPLALVVINLSLIVSGASLPRIWPILIVWLGFAAMGMMVLRAAPSGAAHWYFIVACAFFSVPLVGITLAVFGLDKGAIRDWVTIPVTIIGVALPSVSLFRKRQALLAEVNRRRLAEEQLARLNQSLEHQVAQRTADLQHIIRDLESFNRSVSHDLHGPLSGIASLAKQADTSLRQGDPQKALFALPLIADEASTLRTLVNSLLDLARVADATIREQEVDVTALAHQIIEPMRVAGEQAVPEIRVHPMPRLYTDPGLLRTVLTNLIGNAVKFTPVGSSDAIEIGGSSRGEECHFFVRDRGIGFDTDKTQNLFEPFFRLPGNGVCGDGIGLNIVKRAVERLGGKVWADSQPGGGAIFGFSIPSRSIVAGRTATATIT